MNIKTHKTRSTADSLSILKTLSYVLIVTAVAGWVGAIFYESLPHFWATLEQMGR